MKAQTPKKQPPTPKAPRRLALVDGDKNNHLALQRALDTEPNKWILECHLSVREALRRMETTTPHLLLMDFGGREHSGIKILLEVKTRFPNLPVVLFTDRMDAKAILLCLMAGAGGYLVKPVPPAALLRALAQAAQGRVALSPEAQAAMWASFQRKGRMPPLRKLSDREREILLELTQELQDKEIAEHLKMEPNTVHTHLYRLFRKLGVHTRSGAVKKCLGS